MIRWYAVWMGACSNEAPDEGGPAQLLVAEVLDLGEAPATAWITTTLALEAVGELIIDSVAVEAGRGWYGPGQSSNVCGTTPMGEPVGKTTFPATLIDGETLDVALGFGSPAVFPPASLVIEASDRRHAVSLSAAVRGPLLDLSAVDFGSVPVGTPSAPQTLRVTPTEGADLCLNDVLGLGDVELSTPLPQLVRADTGVDLTLTWTPAQQGPYYGSVSLVFGEIGVLAMVSGRGTE